MADQNYVGGKSGNDDLQATDQTNGSIINAGLGNDTLRGGKGDDILTGGGGDDQMFGGDGGDQFRFFGSGTNGIDGASDTDRIYDLDFSEGDSLVFGSYGAGTFTDAGGINAFAGGGSAEITSYEGIVNAVNSSADVTAYRLSPYKDVLVLQVTDSADGQIQYIYISDGYSKYVAAGGVESA